MQPVINLATTYLKVVLVLLLLAIAGLAFGYYRYHLLAQELATTQTQFTSSTEAFQAQVADLQTRLSQVEQEKAELENAYDEEKDRNDEFADQIEDISDTVGVLDKLQKTDEELLQKYSKVYFLNEHYVPQNLVEIPTEYRTTSSDKEMTLRREVWRRLKRLIDRAEDDEIEINIVSAFRDFYTQSSLKNQYKVSYGSGANAFSADQGYSEHQLGTTVDLSTPAISNTLNGFETTPAYKWLLDNAHKYGFVLSYPPNNQYYVFEPWHWRFVGVDLAGDLHRDDANFYDWDQRKINEYLVEIFD